MSARANNEMVGRGVYNLAEVSRYARVAPSTVRAWFKWRSDRQGKGPVFMGDYKPFSEDYAVSFLDLIDANIAGQLRNAGVSMRTIRAAYNALKIKFNTGHPFGHADIYTDGRRVFDYASNALQDEELLDTLTSQHFFPTVRNLLQHIVYDEATNIASRWRISHGIMIDPDVSFGKPVIQGTGVTTFVVSHSYAANESDSALVADLYRVTEEDVINAVRFEEEHGWRKVA